jgi:hypothetical protein
MNKMFILYNSNHINYYIHLANNSAVMGQSPTWDEFIVHFRLRQVDKKCHILRKYRYKELNQNNHLLKAMH